MTDRRPLATRIAGSPHSGRFASLEGYRAIAALSVVVFHVRGNFMSYRPGFRDDVIGNLGNFGVAVFFVLSGFLLFLPLTRSLYDGRAPSSPSWFLLRRFIRIFPAYWLAFIGWSLVANDVQKSSVHPTDKWFLSRLDLSGLGVTWTLTVEIWFYFFIAALMVVLPVVMRGRSARSVVRMQIGFVACVWVVGVVSRPLLLGSVTSRIRYGDYIVFLLDWFAFGMAMAVAVSWRDRGGRLPKSVQGLANRPAACFIAGYACYLLVMYTQYFTPTGTGTEPGFVWLHRSLAQPVAAAFFVLPAILGDPNHVAQRWLKGPWMSMLGTVSYGIYLWHPVVMLWMINHPFGTRSWGWLIIRLAITVSVSTVIATLSYRLVERPFSLLVPSGGPPSRRRAARPDTPSDPSLAAVGAASG